MPASQILRKIATTGKWFKRWRIEQGLPLKKVQEPLTEDELRIISLTPFLSKIFEKIAVDWLMVCISDKLDVNQYGGRKGSSINHYLIDFISFILYNQDLKEPNAVLAAMVDFQKAFNRQDHLTLITKLCNEMKVPGWLLIIVIGFLQDRELVVTYRGKQSANKKMPGGGPQGTVLGMLLFLILINKAGFPEDNRNFGERFTKVANARKAIKNMHLKYVDDLTLAEAINLKSELSVENNLIWERPLRFHDRTEQTLPKGASQVQQQLDNLQEYSRVNSMKINQDKTKVMIFNNARKYDFQPKLTVSQIELEVVKEMKLLGVVITSNLSWNANTDHITTKASCRLWLLRRLKNLGASQEQLLDVYNKQIRSILEFAAVVWHAGLTNENEIKIERVQKSAFAIILGKNYHTYQNACLSLSMTDLKSRRAQLCKSFAVKAAKHPIHSQWFVQDTPNHINTRQKKSIYKPVNVRTERFLKSAIPYLTNILNQQ